MDASRSASQRLDDFARSLVGMAADGVTVEAAHAEFRDRPDVGDTIIEVTLGLSSPPAGRVTWPLSAIRAFEREIRGRSYELGFEEFVYVDISSAGGASEEPSDDSDELRRDRIPLSDERPDLR